MMEELVWGDDPKREDVSSTNFANPWLPSGSFFSLGPGNYKIPSFGDLPSTFNIHLLRKDNTEACSSVYRSKAVGEPPLFLGSSVLFAVRNAIKEFRQEKMPQHSSFVLDSPATTQRIRLLCHDEFVGNVSTPLQRVNGNF